MKLESSIKPSTIRDNTYLKIKKPRVQSPLSSNFDEDDDIEMDVDESPMGQHAQAVLKKSKSTNRGP